MKVFGVTGWKNGGKTGLMERLVSEISGRGFIVSTIKHAHHSADIDHEGTDTHRHRLAGARQVILSSPQRWAKMTEIDADQEPSLEALVARIEGADLVLVEGYKSASHPKVEAFRSANGHQPLAIRNASIVAIAAKGDVEINLPLFDLDDTNAVADYVLAQVGLSKGPVQANVGTKKLKNDCFALPQGVDWVPVDEALARLKSRLVPVASVETIATRDANGRILAQSVEAKRSNPPVANSAVDGYGFAFDTLPQDLSLELAQGRSAAGDPFKGQVPLGQAARILTGAILPSGVDTVVLQEEVTLSDGRVHLSGAPKRGSNTRKAGEDVIAGSDVLQSGQKLRPVDLALLTAVGVPSVQAFTRLRIGVLSTGDELVDAGATELSDHNTFDANRPMLLSLIESWGYQPVDMGLAPDTPQAIEQRLNAFSDKVDAILTSGGASAGDEDHISQILRTKGDLTSWRIAVKPGRPLALAMWNGTPVFGLPGNPVAALVCALIFGRPALSLLAGSGWKEPQGFMVPAAFTKSKKHGRREYLRARMNQSGHVEVFQSEGSGRISGLSWADGLVELPDEGAEIRAGDLVRYLPYSSFGL
ncbi:MAG: bifunctional molybdopterin-guanine dinucleotide biosynthesis adaptor protein MobB/molybdopterin molybdotransferase MoeA [Paracoccaceae bacterium]|nr:bifunctional molybdopterin-guanine dinucleotide biosynthesis adaptor protein MobB/molybdopterin molybdotransferase MoeA [Paracoccaceae bacterium]MDG2257161.1 bifunctional molybdopterin-guanine dinucleotide biosynthesis adaptor protein MobB/molybdopterin molybdotransferase MoeA [Paracoccaceae bacterium]